MNNLWEEKMPETKVLPLDPNRSHKIADISLAEWGRKSLQLILESDGRKR